jgi:hypothetical protein
LDKYAIVVPSKVVRRAMGSASFATSEFEQIYVFRDLNGRYTKRPDEPPKPPRIPPNRRGEPPRKYPEQEFPWEWVLTALSIFFGTISFAAHMTEQYPVQNSCMFLSGIFGMFALFIFAWKFFKWYEKSTRYRKKGRP